MSDAPPRPLTSAERRALKSRAQRLEATVQYGRAGMSEAWLKTLEEELAAQELVKVRFAQGKEDRKEIAPEIAARTGSELVALVGHVAVYYRARRKEGSD